jgi:hypothetical protein
MGIRIYGQELDSLDTVPDYVVEGIVAAPPDPYYLYPLPAYPGRGGLLFRIALFLI